MADVITTIISGIFTALLAAIAFLYTKNEKKKEEELKKLEAIAKKSEAASQKIAESIAALRGELKFTNNQLELNANGLAKMEGKFEFLSASLAQSTNELTRVQSKLEAVFKFMDAPRRASDL